MADTFKIALLKEGATRMTCREANCGQYRRGWVTMVDESTVMGQGQAHYIRKESGRSFLSFTAAEARERLSGEGISIPDGVTVFQFAPGQTCFGEHLDREVLFAHNRRVHVKPLDFMEDFNESAQRAVETAKRG